MLYVCAPLSSHHLLGLEMRLVADGSFGRIYPWSLGQGTPSS